MILQLLGLFITGIACANGHGSPLKTMAAAGAGHVLSAVNAARSSSLRESCEATVKACMRSGLVNSDTDVLQRARELDSQQRQLRESQEVEESLSSLRLFGVPVFVTQPTRESMEALLEREGALVWDAVALSDELLCVNPRDAAFQLDLRAPTEQASAAALGAVASGKASVAVLSVPAIPRSVAHTGLTAIRLPGEAQCVVCGSSLEDVLLVKSAIAGPERLAWLERAAQSPDSSAAPNSSPLAGVRVGYVADYALEDGVRVEACVASVVRVAAELLEELGADTALIRRADLPAALQGDGDFAAILAPGQTSAAIDKSGPPASASSALRPELLVVSLPGGCVCGEDDGYDSSLNELLEQEGLPVALSIVAGSSSVESMAAALLVARSFEAATRWSREMFRPGVTRQDVKEDLDDAREAFGIYFQTSLLRYVGRRRRGT